MLTYVPVISIFSEIRKNKNKKKKHVMQSLSLPKIFRRLWNHISKQLNLHPSEILTSS